MKREERHSTPGVASRSTTRACSCSAAWREARSGTASRTRNCAGSRRRRVGRPRALAARCRARPWSRRPRAISPCAALEFLIARQDFLLRVASAAHGPPSPADIYRVDGNHDRVRLGRSVRDVGCAIEVAFAGPRPPPPQPHLRAMRRATSTPRRGACATRSGAEQRARVVGCRCGCKSEQQHEQGLDSERAARRGLLWRGQGRPGSDGALSSSVEPRVGSRVWSVTVGWTNASKLDFQATRRPPGTCVRPVSKIQGQR